jgi:hypothetical protein
MKATKTELFDALLLIVSDYQALAKDEKDTDKDCEKCAIGCIDRDNNYNNCINIILEGYLRISKEVVKFRNEICK